VVEVTQADIDAAKLADKRFALIEMSVAMAAELRDSAALRVFMAKLRRDAEDALVEFADANIANPHEIMPLQVKVQAIVFLNRTIEELMNAARNAEAQLNEGGDLNDG
jgi:hypothetical protein